MNEKQKKEAINLLLQLLSIESVTEQGGELSLVQFIDQYLQSYGIRSEIQSIQDGRANLIAQIDNRASSEGVVVWNGHIDTVAYGSIDLWKTNPCVPFVANGFIYARGSSDMKSGLVAMLYAITSLWRQGQFPRQSIRFIATCDEEKNGLGARQILESGYMKDSQVLFIGEPTDNKLGTAQKGCLWIKLGIRGFTAHGAYPEKGNNALEKAYCIWKKLQNTLDTREDPLLGKNTVTMTSLHGGILHNMIPDRSELLLDIRFLPGITILYIVEILEKIIDENNICATIKVINQRNPMHIDSMEKLNTLDKNIEQIGVRYFTDASILTLQNNKIPVILYGPGDPELAHQPNEYVSIENYIESIKFYQNLYKNFCYYI